MSRKEEEEEEEERATTVVAIVSNNYLLRLGLQRIVEQEKWLRLIGQTANVTTFDDVIARERPQIMIIDTEIESDVPGLIQKIKATAPETKTILLTGMDQAECTRQAFACGVDGLVLKIQPSPVLIATIDYLARAAAAPVTFTGSNTAPLNKPHRPTIHTAIATNPAQSKWPDGLTEREQEVVRLVSEGLSNKDIANRLCISSITVRHHLTSIFDKLGVSNRQKLLLRAHQNGLTRPPALA